MERDDSEHPSYNLSITVQCKWHEFFSNEEQTKKISRLRSSGLLYAGRILNSPERGDE